MFKKKPQMFRQGDVLIRRVKAKDPAPELEPVQREDGRLILAHGEVTGHAHAIADPGVIAWQIEEGKMLMEIPRGGATLSHEEHTAIELPPGQYEVIRQREWSPSDERSVFVAD